MVVKCPVIIRSVGHGKTKSAAARTQEQTPASQSDFEPQALGGGGGAGGTTTYYVHGPRGIHAQVSDADDIWKWMAQDGLNSVRSVVDNGMNVLESVTLDPYGNPISMTGSSQTEYGYTGEVTDPNELVYLRNRYYNPSLGTFISQDPVEGSMNNPMSLNRYAYVQGNPVNKTDPSGHAPNLPIGQQFTQMMYADPLRFANMMNAGLCLAQVPTGTGTPIPTFTPTPFPGTLMPSTFHVPCNFSNPFLNVRREPSLLAPIINIVNNPAGIEFQVSSFVPGDTQLGGTGWWYVNSLAGWVYDGSLRQGTSPCPRTPILVTPTPQVPGPTPTPSISDLDTISRVISCEADRVFDSVNGIAHAIYNRMTSGAAEWANYRTALSIIQNTGIDCYPNKYQGYPTSNASNQAAQWLLGMGSAPELKNPLIDLRAYYWLGVPTPSDLTNPETTFAYIVDNPNLYNYSACGVNETRETRLRRLRDRFVGIDASDGDLTTIYFSLNPLCEQ